MKTISLHLSNVFNKVERKNIALHRTPCHDPLKRAIELSPWNNMIYILKETMTYQCVINTKWNL